MRCLTVLQPQATVTSAVTCPHTPRHNEQPVFMVHILGFLLGKSVHIQLLMRCGGHDQAKGRVWVVGKPRSKWQPQQPNQATTKSPGQVYLSAVR
jgi:hypothetical protein